MNLYYIQNDVLAAIIHSPLPMKKTAIARRRKALPVVTRACRATAVTLIARIEAYATIRQELALVLMEVGVIIVG
jgi:hypothetical protein